MRTAKLDTFKPLKSLVAIAAFATIAFAPAANAGESADAVVVSASESRAQAQAMSAHYAEGMRLRASGDFQGAYVAFNEAARMGHAKSQVRLGQIYDLGDEGVQRDYLQSLRWNQAAREQGEAVPTVKARAYVLVR